MKPSDVTVTTLAGDQRRDLITAALAARVHTTIVGASTLRVALPDEFRKASLDEARIAHAEGRDWSLVAIRREAGRVRLVYEDTLIARLRRDTDRIMYQVAIPAADLIDRFCTDADVPVTIDPIIGQIHIEGAGRSILDPTTSWQEIAALAAKLGGRAFSDGERIIVTTDAALLAGNPTRISDSSGAVTGDIDFTLDVAQPNDRAALTVAPAWQIDAGSVVDVHGTGPADGRWVVSEWTRDLPQAGAGRVRLTRPRTLGA